MMEKWLKERKPTDVNTISCYCPLDGDNVVVGLSFMGSKPPFGAMVGEFWFDENLNICVELYQ